MEGKWWGKERRKEEMKKVSEHIKTKKKGTQREKGEEKERKRMGN